MRNCYICHSHGLAETDFSLENNTSNVASLMSLSTFTTDIKLKVVTCLKCN